MLDKQLMNKVRRFKPSTHMIGLMAYNLVKFVVEERNWIGANAASYAFGNANASQAEIEEAEEIATSVEPDLYLISHENFEWESSRSLREEARKV